MCSRFALFSLAAALLSSAFGTTAPARAGSVGKVDAGRLVEPTELPLEGEHHYILPRRHKWRGLRYGTRELVGVIREGAAAVAKRFPRSRLGVGNLSRKKGGRIRYSHSHQSGRDADLSFYMTDRKGKRVPPRDLVHFSAKGTSKRGVYRFDVERQWVFVEALLSSSTARIQWLLISAPLKKKLLAHARSVGAPAEVVKRAEDVLHQPRWALPHDDHLHVRIYCPESDREDGCRDTGPIWPWIKGAGSP